MIEILINDRAINQRVDKYVRKLLNEAPLNFVYKIFRKKDVKINGKWVDIDYILQKGDVLRVYVTDEQLATFNKPKEVVVSHFSHQIIYEDDNILIVNKPAGLLVHGDNKEKKVTLANQVLSYLSQKGEYDPSVPGYIPAPVHRLDRNTSGLIITAKNLPSQQILEKLFKTKTEIVKEYYALVVGHPEKSGTINLNLEKDQNKSNVRVVKHGGQPALTTYQVETYFPATSLLRVQILTGRTHQIRVHLQAIGHPIIGDQKYGDFKFNGHFQELFGLKSQYLFARSIRFKEVGGQLAYLSNKTFICPWPELEKKILNHMLAKKKELNYEHD